MKWRLFRNSYLNDDVSDFKATVENSKKMHYMLSARTPPTPNMQPTTMMPPLTAARSSPCGTDARPGPSPPSPRSAPRSRCSRSRSRRFAKARHHAPKPLLPRSRPSILMLASAYLALLSSLVPFHPARAQALSMTIESGEEECLFVRAPTPSKRSSIRWVVVLSSLSRRELAQGRWRGPGSEAGTRGEESAKRPNSCALSLTSGSL